MYESAYPINMLSSELQDFLSKLFKEIPDAVMIGFYSELLDSLARDIRNGRNLLIIIYPSLPLYYSLTLIYI